MNFLVNFVESKVPMHIRYTIILGTTNKEKYF